jgi:magnesium-transporting ATPase (P-type)
MRTKVMDYLKVMALCHSVTIDARDGSYSAASPDELAFVQFAKDAGYEF